MDLAGAIGGVLNSVNSWGDLLKRGMATAADLGKIASDLKGDTKAEIGSRKESKEARSLKHFSKVQALKGLMVIKKMAS